MSASRRIAIGVAIAATLLVATLAIPVDIWRTGEPPSPPLPIIETGPRVPLAERLWVDTDAGCGAGRRVDADDCFALLVLARARRTIVGVSAVHGNADIQTVTDTLQGLQSWLAAEGTSLGPLYRGAEDANPAKSRLIEESAFGALRTALQQGPLTIVALGPLTNIAAAVDGRPDLAANIMRIVAVMGRRKGHLFHPSEARGGGALLGHGPVFRDFNFVKDRAAATALVRTGIPMTLVPYEVARDFVVRSQDLARMESSGLAASSWVAARAGSWLGYWRREVGLDGFYPFDALAALYVVDQSLFDCAIVRLWIEPRRPALEWVGFGSMLYVGIEGEAPATAEATSEVVYCPRARAAAHQRLMALLVQRGPVR